MFCTTTWLHISVIKQMYVVFRCGFHHKDHHVYKKRKRFKHSFHASSCLTETVKSREVFIWFLLVFSWNYHCQSFTPQAASYCKFIKFSLGEDWKVDNNTVSSVLLNCFLINDHTSRFLSSAKTLKRPGLAMKINRATWKYWSLDFIWMVAH